MECDCLQDEVKLILTYPHKAKFNRIGCLVMILLSVIILWVLNHLIRYDTVFSDTIIIVIVLTSIPLLVWFMGYYLFINGVKLEIYEKILLNIILIVVEGRVYCILNLNLKI